MLDLGRPSAKDYWETFQAKFGGLLRENPPTELCRWGWSPHTPFTVSRELLDLAGRRLEGHRNLLTTMHLGESREEWNYFRKGTGPMAERIRALNPDWNLPRGTTPVQYLNRCGWLPKLDLGVHLNLVDAKDLRLLAKNRITVVHCPGSHAYFGHPPFGYQRMRRHRVPVCLGTDSLASNSSLSLFREMRLFQKAHPEVSAQEILSMVTVKPAQALGLGHQLGRIKPGFLADLIGIPLARGGGATDAFHQVLRYRGKISFAMVQGEPRLRVS
jgi:cytosine/adenosine deaminase-related metal-dependent hydrolase